MTTSAAGGNPPLLNSRAHFEPLGFSPADDDALIGTASADALRGDPPVTPAPGLPGALAFWAFDGGLDGRFDDARGGPAAGAWRVLDGTAVANTAPTLRAGPDGTPGAALAFDGESTFAFIGHDPAMEITQGTIALWIQPDTLDSGKQIVLSKDERNAGDGGHFRLGINDEGRIFVRFAEGDGGSNKAWTSSKAYFAEGQWTHVAVSFTAEGITVYADGVAVPDYAWYREEGKLDSPAHATEAYLLQNEEPWFLGTDTSGAKVNDSPEAWAASEGELDDAFTGAVADLGLWGGFTPDDALDAAEVLALYTSGPGTALTAPSGPQPLPAGNDTLDGGDGNDTLLGDAGDDELLGGHGEDDLQGGYGDDLLDGGDGNDVLDGGRGSDLLLGGAGDDLLVSRSDAGEQRIGQRLTGNLTRPDPDHEVNPDTDKLYGWEDQPLVADDILVGGDGRDTFLFNPQINAKRDILLEHVNDDRSIEWARVAGENNEQHDHWVDNFGIDFIADYRADEDTIAIIGHTATPEVDHKLVDSDGDGTLDELISVITVYSNQHGGGGAHDQDLIGQIVVYGDAVDPDDIVRDAGVTHGIVDTVDELQEALAPSGTTKTSLLADGSTFHGYDSRNGEDPGEVVANPERFSDNPFLDSDRFTFAGNVPDDVPAPVAVIDALSHPELAALAFTGNGEDAPAAAGAPGAFFEVPHQGRAAGLAQTTGTIAFAFVADAPGATKQVLFSKDASGYVDGGHLTAWLDHEGHPVVRFQSTDHSVYLGAWNVHAEAGQLYHFAFTFDDKAAKLFIDGELEDTENLAEKPAFLDGMLGNTESLVLGASTMHRTSGELNNLKYHFDGTIAEFTVLDRALYDAEAYKLALGALDVVPSEGGAAPSAAEAAPDLVIEGSGTPDALTGDAGNDDISAGAGNDTVEGLAGDDVIRAGTGDDVARGGEGNDAIAGGEGQDELIGGDGEDLLFGEDGDDVLLGGAGDDHLAGGAGDDELTGGEGRDAFVWDTADARSMGLDVVRDFRSGEDTLHFSRDLDVLLNEAGGVTRITLLQGPWKVVGEIEVHGDAIEFGTDLLPVPATDTGDLFL